jgi:hypothetical protein
MADDFEIKADSQKYWGNVPHEIASEDVDAPDAPRDHTLGERGDEEVDAENDE